MAGNREASGAGQARALDTLATVAMLVIASGLAAYVVIQKLFSAPAYVIVAAPPPEQPLSLVGAELLGHPSAEVVLIQYSDFLCPACGRFANDVLPVIRSRYVDTGRVLFAFRHFPIGELHPIAFKAAEGAACAGKQGRFWDMHDLLFSEQARNATETLRALESRLTAAANDLGLDADSFESCLAGSSLADIQMDAGGGLLFGVDRTPEFLLGRRENSGSVRVLKRMSGLPPRTELADAIDEVLALISVPPAEPEIGAVRTVQ